VNQVQRTCTGTDLSIPDGITPIRGIRVFGLDERGRLSSSRFRHYFRPGENVATCQARHPTLTHKAVGAVDLSVDHHRGDTTVPKTSCTCGFYGFWDLDSFLGKAWASDIDWADMRKVVGLVDAYGKVLLGTRGFRAQKCRVVAVSVRRRDAKEAARMKTLYPDLPVFKRTKAMVKAFPLYEPGGEGDALWEWDRE
jgi:hypothetical protein